MSAVQQHPDRGITGPAVDRFTELTSTDSYCRSPGNNETLLIMLGAEHVRGGISGYDAAETTDENPERVAALRALV
ncbi:MAG: hypothetical protein ABJA16_08100 [Nakamurella sp.]